MGEDALKQLGQACADEIHALWPKAPSLLVLGDGNAQRPPLMLVGEAPGEQEALQGKPFVGKAGKNLTEFLRAIGLERSALYISNVVKFRPTQVSAAGRVVNRPPTRAEIALFTPWLMREVAIVRPRALVTLGNVALNAFRSQKAVIGDHHGRWQAVRIDAEGFEPFTIPLFALYHPASVIYNRSLADVYRADLRTLAETLSQSGTFMDS